MKTAQLPQSILVPVLDGDISETTLARGRSILAASDARLVLLHIARKPAPDDANAPAPFKLDDAQTPRWRQLAAAAHPGRVFVEAVQGDPARIIAVEAERFRSDTILLDQSFADTARATPFT
ncbi:MAG: universal stress protein [Gemmatimonadaceae bacterium]